MPEENNLAPEGNENDGALPQDDGNDPSQEIERLRAELAEKEAHLKKKSEQFHNLRNQKFRSFSEMTPEEKELYTPEQLEVFERQEILANELEQTKAQQRKQLDDYRTQQITKLSGGDKTVAKQLESNLSRLAGYDSASTQSEIDQYIGDAWKLLGNATPNPLSQAISGGGGMAPNAQPTKKDDGFAETEEGKGLAQAMGLPINNDKK